jgi:triosephosphate isomerase
MKRKPLVVANWKMHGQQAWIEGFVSEFVRAQGPLQHGEVVLCPPFVFLAQLQAALKKTLIGVGAQNVHGAEQGPFTGEVSAPMLKEFDCTHVIVGHSERRTLFGETDATVAARFAAALRGGLVPILCVGENAAERQSGITEQKVREQLDAVVDFAGPAAFANAVVAYEPVWAIGTGKTATPEDAQEVCAAIREEVENIGSPEIASNMRILYGGSVKSSNIVEIMKKADVDGALIGGASLDPEELAKIVKFHAVSE